MNMRKDNVYLKYVYSIYLRNDEVVVIVMSVASSIDTSSMAIADEQINNANNRYLNMVALYGYKIN